MSRDFWSLFSRELKISILVLVGFILLGFAFSWVLAAYGVFGCLIFIYFRFRNRMRNLYCLFIFLSERLIEKKRIYLTKEEAELFLYNPFSFLIARYCQKSTLTLKEKDLNSVNKSPVANMFLRIVQLNVEELNGVFTIILAYEIFFPSILGLLFILVFYVPISDVLLTLAFVYSMPLIFVFPEGNWTRLFWEHLFEIDEKDIVSVTKSELWSGDKNCSPYYKKWRKSVLMYLLFLPVFLRESEIENCLRKRIANEEFGELTTAFQNHELTAKQIYDQIDEKVEAANLTAQELWDLWAEYYFEGYEAKE